MATMELDFATCDRARLARDAAFDGRFFTGVRTTRIYCRPVCPVRPARSENVSYFPSAAAAEQAGYRPCLRCRPETAPFSPAWNGTRATVDRAMRLIDEGALDRSSVAALAERLGIGARHLDRLFQQHLGATPMQVARTARLQRAKRLIDETDLPMTEVALRAGFGSLRRFNAVFAALYRRPPSALRQLRRGPRYFSRLKGIDQTSSIDSSPGLRFVNPAFEMWCKERPSREWSSKR
jgi:AraC family transcriptional regulator of adaptative response/methylated-DNA-[protein]-cysteine methyltransferase